MLIKQLSIFLENKKGRFTEVAKILGEAGVNMSAFTVAENSDLLHNNPVSLSLYHTLFCKH